MAKGKDAEAMAIYQRLMDIVDRAFMDRDPDLHQTAIYVPHHIRSRKEIINIRTAEELRGSFNTYVDFTQGMGASIHRREVQTARFRNKDAIEGVHIVNTLDADGVHVTPPTRTTSIIMRMQGEWRICGSDSTTEKTTGVSDFLRDLMKQNQVAGRTSAPTLRNLTGETS